MVRVPGVEPGHLAARDFKSLVSTYFTILAINSGLPGGTRTPDLQLRRLLLYPVELRAVLFGAGYENRTRLTSLEGWDTTNMPTPH